MLPRDKAAFPKMLKSIRRLVSKRVPAESVVAAIANTLVVDHYPLLEKLPGGSSALRKQVAISQFAEWLSGMDLKDAGFWLSSAYALLVTSKQRRKRAMFFTPPILGERMLDDLERAGVDWASARIIDIACGGAAFLAPAARRMAEELSANGASARSIVVHVQAHLVGIEIQPFLARLSRLFIGMTLYPWIKKAGNAPTIPLVVGDALRHAASLAGQFDAVICNPPYRKLTRGEVSRLPIHLRKLSFWQPNLYAMFMALSAALLKKDGVAGLLTPMSFLSGQSFLRLRKHLATHRQIKCIDIVHEKCGVFLGVEQDTAITILAPRKKRAARVEIFVGDGTAGWLRAGRVHIDPSGGPWILPRREGDAELMAAVVGRSLADYGYVVAVGDVVLHRDPRRRFKTLQAARKAKATHPVPMLRAAEVRADGTLHFQRSDRPDCFVDVGNNPRGLVRDPAVALQRVSAPDQPRRLNCAPVPRKLQLEHDGVLGENHVTFLVARNDVGVSPELLVQILSSEPVDRLFRCRSGANNVSGYELAHLPLPDPTVVRSMLSSGADINAAVRAGFGILEASTLKSNHGPAKQSRPTSEKADRGARAKEEAALQ